MVYRLFTDLFARVDSHISYICRKRWNCSTSIANRHKARGCDAIEEERRPLGKSPGRIGDSLIVIFRGSAFNSR